MNHIKITFETAVQEHRDILIALLSDIGYDGFEETENNLYGYIYEQLFDAAKLNDTLSTLPVSYHTEVVPAQNWNALWESNFPSVIVDDFCTIRAHFHNIEVITPYDIIITPKMSFGTGHHATTQLMMTQMRDIPFGGKSVLDFGTGTGVLAILASMLGAADILAIDNDQWSVENTTENIVRNHCEKIIVCLGSLKITGNRQFEIILANINRHILLQYIPLLYNKIKDNGSILLSGLLSEDKDVILKAAAGAGFSLSRLTIQDNWIAVLFNKH